MIRASSSCRLPRSARCFTVGSFSIGTLDLAISLSVLLHAAVIGAVVYASWMHHDEVHASTDFAQGEQSVTITNLRFISAEELEAMEHPSRLQPTVALQTPAPPPPEPMLVVTAHEVAVSDQPIDMPEQNTQPLPTGSRVAPITSSPHEPTRASPPTASQSTSPTTSTTTTTTMTATSTTSTTTQQTHTPLSTPASPSSTDSTTPAAPASQAPAGITRGIAVADLPVPRYPTMSRRLGEQGLVLLAVSVDVQGRVTDVQVLSDPGHPRLVQAAITAVRAARFTPAIRGGHPVADVVRIPFRFRLDAP